MGTRQHRCGCVDIGWRRKASDPDAQGPCRRV
ncbi:unnamed protein product, partial [Rotaria sp. Silwood2]